jgi:ABC-type protease/lipase transport system fused ATPase/permease subunit
LSIIHVSNLSKAFRVLKRKPGFLGRLRILFFGDYEQVQAVQDISFALAPGELVGYIGPNGAGKSTTICAAPAIRFYGLLALVMGWVFLGLALAFWRVAIRHYQSTGS